MAIKREVEKAVLDDEGKPKLDNEGNPMVETVELEYTDEELEAMLVENTTLKSSNTDLKSTNTRLLDESKDNKTKLSQKVAADAAAKQQKLIDDGKTEEALEEEKKTSKRLQDEVIATKGRSVRTKIENEILKLAPNCHDVNDVIANLNKELYSIDSDNETISGIKEAVEDVQKRKSYLFSLKKMPDSFNNNPDNVNPNSKKKKYTIEEYRRLPTKKAMEEALAAGLVEGLKASAG